jgi:hypothetical protein
VVVQLPQQPGPAGEGCGCEEGDAQEGKGLQGQDGSLMNKHLDQVRNVVDKAKAFMKPGPRPHTLVKQMVEEQGRWNDLFSTKLIETLERVARLGDGEKQLRLECMERIAAVEDLSKRMRLDLAEKLAALEEARAPRERQAWVWACSLTALLVGLCALVLSLRGLR